MSQPRPSLWSKYGRCKTWISHSFACSATLIHIDSSGPRCTRPYTGSAEARKIIVRIPKSNVYRFGDSHKVAPVFCDVDWTVEEGQNWAVIGRGSNQKTALLQTLGGHMRIAPSPPSPGGLFPFLSDPPKDAHTAVALVSFAHRPSSAGSTFYDYTTRYGAVRDEERITLRESIFGEHDFLNLRPKGGQVRKTLEERAADQAKKAIFEDLSTRLGLSPLLDLPLIALSNGQTRRARIVKAILAQPELLLLDEPLTGLDVNSRPTLLSVLRSLHEARRPRIIIGLRVQDPIPDWITHLALVSDGNVHTGAREEMLEKRENLHRVDQASATPMPLTTSETPTDDQGEPVVVMKNVNVAYGECKILKSINWTIRPGERWHLQGANGSGKTTLLSVITGDHPQSYTQRGTSHLSLFARPRPHLPTPHLRTRIGVVSPELANAYPRRVGTTVWEVVGTGFDGGFVPGGTDGVGATDDEQQRRWRVQRAREVIGALGPRGWGGPAAADAADETFAKRAFVDLALGEQSIVLLMRALVGRPPLVLLDEVWAGMDERMVCAARRYLREGGVGRDQAVVVVSHWEEEVPWRVEDGLCTYRLQRGVGIQV